MNYEAELKALLSQVDQDDGVTETGYNDNGVYVKTIKGRVYMLSFTNKNLPTECEDQRLIAFNKHGLWITGWCETPESRHTIDGEIYMGDAEQGYIGIKIPIGTFQKRSVKMGSKVRIYFLEER